MAWPRVRELEVWSKPGVLMPPEYGKELAQELWAVDIPREVFLGLSAIPDEAHIINLRMAIEAGELSLEDFKSFCLGHSLAPQADSAESASKFLEYSLGRPLAWVHIAEDSNPQLLKRIVDLMRARGHKVIDPETFGEVS